MNLLSIGIFKAASVLAIFSDDIKNKLDNAIEAAKTNMEKYSNTVGKGIAVIASLGASTAFASDAINEQTKKTDGLKISLTGVVQTTSELIQLTRELELARIQGNESAALAIEKQILSLKYQAETAAEKREELATEIIKNTVTINKTFSDAIKEANRQADEARKSLLKSSKDEGAINELIRLRQKMEGEPIREQIVKLQFLADESGAKEAIAELNKQLSALYENIRTEEINNFNEKLQEGAKKSAESFKVMQESLLALQKIGSELTFQIMNPNLTEFEKTYFIGLQQIEVERQKAIQEGQALKLIDEQTVKKIEQLGINKQLAESNKVIQDIMAEQKKRTEENNASLKMLQQDILKGNEALLRTRMSKEQIIGRELILELEKYDAIENQLESSNELTSANKELLNIARKTAIEVAKSKDEEEAKTGKTKVEGALVQGQNFLNEFSKIPNMIAQIISAIARLPELIVGIFDGVTELFTNQIYNFPTKLRKSLERMLNTLNPDMFNGFINNIMESIPRIISMVVAELPKKINEMTSYFGPQIIGALIGAVIEAIPEIVAYLSQAFTTELPKTIFLLIAGIVQGLKKAFGSFGKMFKNFGPIFVKSMEQATRDMIDAFKSIFTGESMFKGAGEMVAVGFSDGLKKLTGSSEQLFGIGEDTLKDPLAQAKDLIAEAKKIGKTIWDEIVSAVKRFWEWIKGVGAQIWAGFVSGVEQFGDDMATLGTAIWNAFVTGAEKSFAVLQKLGAEIWNGLKLAGEMAFNFLTELGRKIWNGLVVAGEAAFNWVTAIGAKIWNGFVLAAELAINWIKGIGTKIWDGLKLAAEMGWYAFVNLGSGIWEGLQSGFDNAGNFFAGIGTKIWEGLKAGFENVTSGMGSLLNNLNPNNLLQKVFAVDSKGKGKVETFLGMDFPWANFASGGLVPGKPKVFGDSLANDTVPALLSPGEAVIPRSLMQDPAIGKLVAGILGQGKVGQYASGLLGAAKNVVSSTQQVATPQWILDLYNSLKTLVSSISLTDLALNPRKYIESTILGNLEKIVKNPMLDGMRSTLRMSEGGIVPGQGSSDSVRALLTPGEFVVRKSAVNSLGESTLANLNRGAGSAGNVNNDVKISLNIQTSQAIDADFIKSKLMPTLKEEMRKASLRGEFLLSARGVRA